MKGALSLIHFFFIPHPSSFIPFSEAFKRAAHVVNGRGRRGLDGALLFERVKLLALLKLAPRRGTVAAGGERRAEVPAVERVVAAMLRGERDGALKLLGGVAVKPLAEVDPAQRVCEARLAGEAPHNVLRQTHRLLGVALAVLAVERGEVVLGDGFVGAYGEDAVVVVGCNVELSAASLDQTDVAVSDEVVGP